MRSERLLAILRGRITACGRTVYPLKDAGVDRTNNERNQKSVIKKGLAKGQLKKGQEYSFYFGTGKKVRKGVFTGEYTENGNAIIKTKKKGEWSIAPSELFIPGKGADR